MFYNDKKMVDGIEYYIDYHKDLDCYDIYSLTKRVWMRDKSYPVKVIMSSLDMAEKILGFRVERVGFTSFRQSKEI